MKTAAITTALLIPTLFIAGGTLYSDSGYGTTQGTIGLAMAYSSLALLGLAVLLVAVYGLVRFVSWAAKPH